MWLFALTVFTTGSVLCGAAWSLGSLIAFRVAQGITSNTSIVDLRLFSHRPLAAASALNVMSRLSIFGALILIPLYYQQVRGHDALTAGLLLAPQSLGTLLALPYVGTLTDRIGARPVVLTGIAVTTFGALAYTQVSSHTNDLVLAASLLVWGIGIAAVAVPVSAAAYQGLPATKIPSATSVITMVQTIGASIGAAVLAAILQNRTAHRPGALAAAFADTFWWVLGFSTLAVIPALLLPMGPAGKQGADPPLVASEGPGESARWPRRRARPDGSPAYP
jgi:MFS family permease